MLRLIILVIALLGMGAPPGESSPPPPPAAVTPDYVPELEAISRPAGVERVLTVEQWRAIRHSGAPPEMEWWLARTGWCEGHLDPASRNGPHVGAWQVNPTFHGPPGDTLDAQAQQAARILNQYGTAPWEGANGCQEWR